MKEFQSLKVNEMKHNVCFNYFNPAFSNKNIFLINYVFKLIWNIVLYKIQLCFLVSFLNVILKGFL